MASELVNQHARKVLFTCVVYTKMVYSIKNARNGKSISKNSKMNKFEALGIQEDVYSTAQNQANIECAFAFVTRRVKRAHAFCCVRLRLNFAL